LIVRGSVADRPHVSGAPIPSAHGGDLKAVLKRYFGGAHRDAPAVGCPMSALAVDAAREQGQLGATFSDGMAAYLRELAVNRPDGTVVEEPDAQDRTRAIHTLSVMVGSMVLARASAVAAPALSEEILTTSLDVLTRPSAT
jgi:TetR/AcrR family transcriptional regulator, transcriptional repressor for nem operon